MAMQTFREAFETDNQPCNITGPDGTVCEGFFANVRVFRDSLPRGWYAYDIRHDDEGDPCEIKNDCIFVDHLGTFCTQTPLPLERKKSWHTYIDGTSDFELNFL